MTAGYDGENIADAIDGITRAIRLLGNADAATPMGAIEAFGAVVKEGLSDIAAAIGNHAEATDRLAEAVERLTRTPRRGDE